MVFSLLRTVSVLVWGGGGGGWFFLSDVIL